MREELRLQEHRRRHQFTASLPWRPGTDGWRRVFAAREVQLRRLEDRQQRWDGWTDLMQAGVLMPNFTTIGFKVARTPIALHEKLHQSLMQGLLSAPAEELTSFDDRMMNPHPRFILQQSLNAEVLTSLKAMHEEWSGMPLSPVQAYGMRVYGNGSTLMMHHDRVNDHIISSIVHVDHSGEPWPLVIEGFDGRTHEVALQPGEMLFYESSKCLHGRPRPFRGGFYASVFVHYQPADWHARGVHIDDVVYAVPESWQAADDAAARDRLAQLGVSADALPVLALASTGLYEEDCTDRWCALAQSVQYVGGGEHGHEPGHESHEAHEGHAGDESADDATETTAATTEGAGLDATLSRGSHSMRRFHALHDVAQHALHAARRAEAHAEPQTRFGWLVSVVLLGMVALFALYRWRHRRRPRTAALVSASKVV